MRVWMMIGGGRTNHSNRRSLTAPFLLLIIDKLITY